MVVNDSSKESTRSLKCLKSAARFPGSLGDFCVHCKKSQRSPRFGVLCRDSQSDIHWIYYDASESSLLAMHAHDSILSGRYIQPRKTFKPHLTYSSSSSSSPPSTATTPPPFLISPNSLPCRLNRSPNAFLAPWLLATSQTCTVAFDPAAASVSGVSGSGEKRAVKILPCSRQLDARCSWDIRTRPRSREVTRLISLFPSLHVLSLLVHNVPDLHHLVHASRGDTASDVGVDVECCGGTVVG
jgi:hypothetical protein